MIVARVLVRNNVFKCVDHGIKREDVQGTVAAVEGEEEGGEAEHKVVLEVAEKTKDKEELCGRWRRKRS